MASSNPASDVASTVHTYHCLCSHLTLATTYALQELSRRRGEALDRALILPKPAISNSTLAALQTDTTSSGPNDDFTAKHGSSAATVLISLPLAAQPIIVRRSDGIEKRYLLQCGRCRLTVGYQLDWAQWQSQNQARGKKGRRDDVVYLLPNALLSTEAMLNGKRPKAGEVGFGLGGE